MLRRPRGSRIDGVGAKSERKRDEGEEKEGKKGRMRKGPDLGLINQIALRFLLSCSRSNNKQKRRL